MCSTVARAILNEQIETFLCYSFSFVLEEIMKILKKKKKTEKSPLSFYCSTENHCEIANLGNFSTLGTDRCGNTENNIFR